MDALFYAPASFPVAAPILPSLKLSIMATPWVLAKDDSKQERLKTVLYNLVEAIRIITVYLQAYLPETAEKIFTQINTDIKDYDSTLKFGYYISGTKVNAPEVLFKRIEKESN